MQLTLSNIYKSYNGVPVLKGCTFSFDSEGMYVLTGPNGSGKSKLLRICAFLEHPDSGEINYLKGSNILKKDLELKRKITLVLPKVGVFNTTVFKNVAYGLKIRGINKNGRCNSLDGKRKTIRGYQEYQGYYIDSSGL